MQHTEIQKIANWASSACTKLSATRLFPHIKFQQSRAVSFGGLAIEKNGEYIMRISVPVWDVCNEEQKQELVTHEICHIVNCWRNEYDSPHGLQWQKLMHICGHPNPSRLCGVERPKRKDDIEFRCDCPETIYMGKIQYRRFLNGKKYFCKRCKASVIPQNVSPRILDKP